MIVTATFRIYPRAASSRTVLLRAASHGPLCDLGVQIIGTTLVASAITLSGSTAGETHTLAAQFEALEAAAIDQADHLSGLAGALATGSQILDGAEEAKYWEQTATSLLVSGPAETSLRLKASVRPSDVTGWLARLLAVAGRAGLAATWQAHVGHGLIEVRLTGEPAALPVAVSELRAEALAHRGSLMVTDAPPALSTQLDPWGPSPALTLMRRVKEQFDPHNTLNPGRFIGGI